MKRGFEEPSFSLKYTCMCAWKQQHYTHSVFIGYGNEHSNIVVDVDYNGVVVKDTF